jgi:carbon-monoxide dehydrogenase medium subunit
VVEEGAALSPVVEEGAALSPVVEEGALRPSRNHPQLSDGALAAAGDLALAELDPADDLHASAAYRAQLVRVLTGRVLRAAYADALRRGGRS